jgi:putative acyl-CoA dehydrogenase
MARVRVIDARVSGRWNASSEIEFENARAPMVSEPGHGMTTIIKMVNYTRLEWLVGSMAGMRFGLAQAIHHPAYRTAFGAKVIDQTFMQNLLANLAPKS